MELKIMTQALMNKYRVYLYEEEKSIATINKYTHDIQTFYTFLSDDKIVTKEKVKEYKEKLLLKYKPSSINSMLAALNQFFEFNNWQDCKIKELKVQKKIFLDENQELTKDEYQRLVNTALKTKK